MRINDKVLSFFSLPLASARLLDARSLELRLVPKQGQTLIHLCSRVAEPGSEESELGGVGTPKPWPIHRIRLMERPCTNGSTSNASPSSPSRTLRRALCRHLSRGSSPLPLALEQQQQQQQQQ